MPYILDEASFMGLDKGTYYLYLDYWVNLDPILCGPDYVSLQYPTKIDKEKTKHDFILSDISKRKFGVPYKGYVKSNAVKLIVE